MWKYKLAETGKKNASEQYLSELYSNILSLVILNFAKISFIHYFTTNVSLLQMPVISLHDDQLSIPALAPKNSYQYIPN